LDLSVSGHLGIFLFALGTVFGTRLIHLFHTTGIKSTAHDMVSYAWQILDLAAADQYRGMFLKVMTFSWDITGNFLAGRKPYPGDFAQSRIGLFRGSSIYPDTNAPALRTAYERRRGIFGLFVLAAFSDQLVKSWHVFPSLSFLTTGRILAKKCVLVKHYF
jgi:hypothetical protein